MKSKTIQTHFPHPIISKIQGEPTYSSIRTIATQIYANASSVPSTLSGGHHGHLGLVLRPQRYLTVAAAIYERPDPRSNNPTQQEELKTLSLLEVMLKAMLTQAVEPEYLADLHHPYTGFANHTTCGIIIHLYTIYGKISPKQLYENNQAINRPYDPTQPIPVFLKHIYDCTQYAEDGLAPYSTEQTLNIAFYAIQRTGLYKVDCRAWMTAKPKTWETFAQHFTKAAQMSKLERTEEDISQNSLQNQSYQANLLETIHQNHENNTHDMALALHNIQETNKQSQNDTKTLIQELINKLTVQQPTQTQDSPTQTYQNTDFGLHKHGIHPK